VRVRRSWRRRTATALVFTALFFAGAALSAGAGNVVAHIDAGSTDPAVETDVATTETTETGETVTATDETTTTVDETTTEAVVDPSAETPVTTTDVTTTTTDSTTEPTVTDTTAAAPALPEATPDDGAVAPAPAPASASAPAPAPAAAPAAAAPVVQHAAPAPAVPAPAAPAAAPAPMQPAASPFPVIAFDPQAWLVDHPGTPVGNAAVAIAERYIGVPYVWGGNKPTTGFDCSGLTQFVYAQLGVWLPHNAAAQFLAYQRLDPSQLQPGDLVFFEPKADGPGHVAIYAGGDRIVEAPHTGADVRIGSLSGAAAALGFLGAVRPSSAALPVVRRVSVAHHRAAALPAAPGIADALAR
jgi:cell wall-associated NlpC family hydrolase